MAHSGCLDELRTRFPLLINGLLGKATPPEETAVRLLLELLRLLQMGDRLGMEPSSVQNLDAVLRLAYGSVEEFAIFSSFGKPLLDTGLQKLETLPNVLKGIEDTEKRSHRHNLSAIQLDAHAVGIGLGEQLP